MLSNKYFSFAKIVKGRNASVRITEDSMFWAVDLVTVFTGKNKNNAGEVIRTTPEEVFSSGKIREEVFLSRKIREEVFLLRKIREEVFLSRKNREEVFLSSARSAPTRPRTGT